MRIVLRCGLQVLVNVWGEMNNPEPEDVDLDNFHRDGEPTPAPAPGGAAEGVVAASNGAPGPGAPTATAGPPSMVYQATSGQTSRPRVARLHHASSTFIDPASLYSTLPVFPQ
jgi:hypothetical protein